LTYYALGNSNQAEESLRKVFGLDPGYSVIEGNYPMGFIKIFNQIKAEIKAKIDAERRAKEKEKRQKKVIEKPKPKAPEKKKKKFPVLIVVLGVALVAAVAVLLTKKTSPGGGNGTPQPTENPEFTTSTDNLTVPEGGTAAFEVKLSAVPSSNVSVSVSRVSGDADINVQSGSSLTFTTSNWNQNQTITLAANEDTDTVNDTSVIRISATGIPNKDITAAEQDNDILRFVTNTNSVTIPEGRRATFEVKLSNQPSANINATVSKVSGDGDIYVQSGGNLTFTPSNWNTYQPVTLGANEDADQTDGQAAIRISASGIENKDITAIEDDNDGGGGQPPSISITNPANGATVNGTVTIQTNVSASSGVNRVEFYIDGDHKYTDTSSPYTYNWNTTSYPDGTHFIKAVVYDNSNRTDEAEILVTVRN